MSPANRRTNQRYACDIPVWLLERDGSGEPLFVELENISSGGFLCRVLDPLPLGALFELRVELPQRADLVRVVVEVRHVRQTEQGDYAVGLMLTDVTSMTKRGFMASLEAAFS